MRKYTTVKLVNIFFLLVLFIIINAFDFKDNPPSGWYQQFLPNTLGSQVVNDMQFLDSLNGYMITSRNVNPDTASILKTTDGGDNWATVFSQGSRRFTRIKFVNNTTGFVSGGTGSGTPYVYKTTNAGINWFIQSSFGCSFWDDMFVLNEDTLWTVDHTSLCGGVFRTTNGGVNWTQQFSMGTQNPGKIYFYNARIGFIGREGGTSNIRRTTDGGLTWTLVLNGETFTDIHFIDSLTGWKCWGADSIQKTTNGGVNWQQLLLPPTGGFYNLSIIERFSFLNKDTIWGVGARASTSLGFRGLIYRSTNGGQTWGYQLPDTNNISIGRYSFIQFTDKKHGWAYTFNRGVHTMIGGGDTTFITDIEQIRTQIPPQYFLEQNYPNPFNPSTKINYELRILNYVSLKVFDLQGKEIQTLVNKKQSVGSYSVEFNGANLSSGIYFYKLEAENFKETKKMILLK